MVRAALALACASATAALLLRDGPEPPQVVTVQVRPLSGPPEGAMGVAAGPERVLTVSHVLDAGDGLTVLGADGVRRRATVLARDRGLDLALLEVPGLAAPRARTADAHAGAGVRILVRRDGRVRSLPAAVRRRVRARLVDQPGRPRRPSLELAAEIGAGDSGAPVVSTGGKVVGLVYARSTRRVQTAYAVRGRALRRFACRKQAC